MLNATAQESKYSFFVIHLFRGILLKRNGWKRSSFGAHFTICLLMIFSLLCGSNATKINSTGPAPIFPEHATYHQGGAHQRDLLNMIKDYIADHLAYVLSSVQRVLNGNTGMDRVDKITSSFEHLMSSGGVDGFDLFIDFIKNSAIIPRGIMNRLRKKFDHDKDDSNHSEGDDETKSTQFQQDLQSSFNQVSNYLALFNEQLKCLFEGNGQASSCWQPIPGKDVGWILENETADDKLNEISRRSVYDTAQLVDPRLRN